MKRNKKQINETVISKKEINDINNIWQKLTSLLQNDINNINVKYGKRKGIIFYQNEFEINNQTVGIITIKYIMYILESKEELRILQKYVQSLNCEADFDNKIIVVRGVVINGEIQNGLYSDLSHEFHHLYQYHCGFRKTEYANNLYEKIKEGMNSNDVVIKNTSYAIYYTFNHEISAFAAELYQYLIENNYQIDTFSIEDVYSLSKNYKQYKNASDSFDDYIQYNDCINRIEEFFNIPIDNIIGRLNNADNLYEVAFNKVLKKYVIYKNIDTHNGVNNSVDFLNECVENKYKFYDDLIL